MVQPYALLEIADRQLLDGVHAVVGIEFDRTAGGVRAALAYVGVQHFPSVARVASSGW